MCLCLCPTSVFGPLQNGCDLVALLSLAGSVARSCIHADDVDVSFHSTQICSSCGCAVWDLEVHTVGLQRHTGVKVVFITAGLGDSGEVRGQRPAFTREDWAGGGRGDDAEICVRSEQSRPDKNE